MKARQQQQQGLTTYDSSTGQPSTDSTVQGKYRLMLTDATTGTTTELLKKERESITKKRSGGKTRDRVGCRRQQLSRAASEPALSPRRPPSTRTRRRKTRSRRTSATEATSRATSEGDHNKEEPKQRTQTLTKKTNQQATPYYFDLQIEDPILMTPVSEVSMDDWCFDMLSSRMLTCRIDDDDYNMEHFWSDDDWLPDGETLDALDSSGSIALPAPCALQIFQNSLDQLAESSKSDPKSSSKPRVETKTTTTARKKKREKKPSKKSQSQGHVGEEKARSRRHERSKPPSIKKETRTLRQDAALEHLLASCSGASSDDGQQATQIRVEFSCDSAVHTSSVADSSAPMVDTSSASRKSASSQSSTVRRRRRSKDEKRHSKERRSNSSSSNRADSRGKRRTDSSSRRRRLDRQSSLPMILTNSVPLSTRRERRRSSLVGPGSSSSAASRPSSSASRHRNSVGQEVWHPRAEVRRIKSLS